MNCRFTGSITSFFPGGGDGMVLPESARNFASSLVGGGLNPLRIATTDSARFRSSKDAAFSGSAFFLWPQPVAKQRTSKPARNKFFMVNRWSQLWSRAHSAPESVRGSDQPMVLIFFVSSWPSMNRKFAR